MAWIILFLVLLKSLELIAAQQTAFITELPAYSSLNKCAASAVSNAALFFPVAWCSGTSVATDLASCICLQWQNSAAASYQIGDGITASCGASSSSELSSALNVLTNYCQPAKNAAAATTTATSPTYSPRSLESASTTPTSTGALTASNSLEKSASSSSTSNDNPSNTTLFSSTSSTTTSMSSMTTSISPSPTNDSGLSLSDKITISLSIIFGLPGTIAACLAAYYGYLAIKRKQKRKSARSETVLGDQRELNVVQLDNPDAVSSVNE